MSLLQCTRKPQDLGQATLRENWGMAGFELHLPQLPPGSHPALACFGYFHVQGWTGSRECVAIKLEFTLGT